mmetsp:Transcript_5616/g.8550  ORF Transcript_5616/g.8550 Transcript_5616/m.8550 type:complete len:282 (-) Transcript_5616:3-848(-)
MQVRRALHRISLSGFRARYVSAAAATSDLLQCSWNSEGSILTITLTNHRKKNALSKDLMNDLNEVLVGCESSRTRVIILRSDTNVFSSGHDLSEVRAENDVRGLFSLCSELMCRIHKLPQVVIAAVDGLATAAGCQLVASCDLAVASDRALFATPGVNIGLFCSTPAVALSRSVATRKHAMEMLLTGDPVDAVHAMRIGLVNRVVAHQDLDEEVRVLATKIASKSFGAIKLGKQTYNRQVAVDIDSAYKIASDAMVENMVLDDATEGINAFLEKRKPEFMK